MLQAGTLDGGAYLELLGNLADDPEPLVMRSWLGALNGVEFAFVAADLEEEFATYVVDTLGPVLQRIGTEAQPNEGETVALVRSALISFLGNQGQDAAVRKQARKKTKKWLKDSGSIDPALVGITLSLAARDGDADLFEAYRKRFESTQIPLERGFLLFGLGSFDDPKLQDRALEYALGDQVRPTEIFQVAFPLSRTNQGRDRLFRFVTEEWDALAERLPEMFRSMMPQVAGGCSAERLAEAEAFFTKPENMVTGTERTLEKVREQVQDCLELRKREGEAVSKFLKQHSQREDEQQPEVDAESLKEPVG